MLSDCSDASRTSTVLQSTSNVLLTLAHYDMT